MSHYNYRARGRANPCRSSPCHTEMIFPETEHSVPSPGNPSEEEVAQMRKITHEKLGKQQRMAWE